MKTCSELKSLSTHWMQRVFNFTAFFTYCLMRFSSARKFFGRLIPGLISSLGHREIHVWSRRGTQFYLKYPEDMGWESLIIHKDFELGTSDFLKNF